MAFRYSIQIQVMQYTPLCHVTSTCLELTTNQNRTSQLLEIRKPCVERVYILFIFVLKATFNPIKNVFKSNKGKNRLINLLQRWWMHWSVSMVEFLVELSLITLRKPKMSGKNVGWRQNLGLRNRFKKVQNLFCHTNHTLNLTLKFGAKKVRLVRDRIRYGAERVNKKQHYAWNHSKLHNFSHAVLHFKTTNSQFLQSFIITWYLVTTS